MASARARVLLLFCVMLAACGSADPPAQAARDAGKFPEAHRPHSPIVSARYSTEEARDRAGEAELVMERSGVAPGMTVADIGAGEGYYTVRLAQRVGPEGRVLAEDVVPAVRDRLAERVTREALDNVSVKLGEAADPKLPPASFDRIYMIHMYHEIERPYELLWRMRPSLRPGGLVVVVDIDRRTDQHGTPPALLDCEMAAVGYTLVRREPMSAADAYLALYAARGPRPAPEAIRPCGPPAPPPRPR